MSPLYRTIHPTSEVDLIIALLNEDRISQTPQTGHRGDTSILSAWILQILSLRYSKSGYSSFTFRLLYLYLLGDIYFRAPAYRTQSRSCLYNEVESCSDHALNRYVISTPSLSSFLPQLVTPERRVLPHICVCTLKGNGRETQRMPRGRARRIDLLVASESTLSYTIFPLLHLYHFHIIILAMVDHD